MAFELWTDGLTVVDRTARLFNKRVVARDPLSGVVDSVNTIFYANYYPLLSSGSVGLYVGGNTAVSSSSYTIDYDAGCFVLTPAPVSQPTASYTFAKYSETTIRSVMVAGFDEMEGRWFRGLSLSSTLSAITPITESSSLAYIVNSTGSDPTVGSITWSQSRAQIDFYAKCTQLAFYRTLAGEHALSDFIWKEAQGLTVDKSKTVPNLMLVIGNLEKALTKIQEGAQLEWYGSDAMYGGAISPPATREFLAHRYWQKASSDEDWRSSTKYRGNVW